MYKVGHHAWLNTYSTNPRSDNRAMATCDARIRSEFHGLNSMAEGRDATLMLAGAAKWVDGGCRIIDTTEDYFAAMGCTDLSESVGDELRVPWPAFVVRLPAGAIVDADGYEYALCIVFQMQNIVSHDPSERCSWSGILTIGKGENDPIISDWHRCNLADTLFGRSRAEKVSELSDSDSSLRLLIRKAIVGLLYTMQHTNHWKHGGRISPVERSGRLRGSPPPHRAIFIGRPLKVDCKEYVRDVCAGRRVAAPSVQTMVRGHLKRQVVGKGRKGRKVIWVEPYWRGPEDAPILSRPYLVSQ